MALKFHKKYSTKCWEAHHRFSNLTHFRDIIIARIFYVLERYS